MSKFIIATKTITYDVEAIRESWAENNGGIPPTDEEIGEIVTEWVREDMRLTSDEFDLRWTEDRTSVPTVTEVTPQELTKGA